MKKLKEKMLKLHLSPKKEILKLSLIVVALFVIGFILSFLMKSWLYIGFALALSTIISYVYLSRYSLMIDKVNQENINEFVNLFSYFRIYIKNGFNVYTSLKEITNFANQNLKEMLGLLIQEIDEDKSIKPFMKFSKNFDDIIIEEMMISIYQIIDDGEKNNYLNQFELIFDKFSDLLMQRNLKKKDSSLSSLSTAPLIGSCFLIIMITVGIIGVLGDMMNVL